MAEAITSHDAETVDVVTPAAGYSPGQVVQLPDGRAGVVQGQRALVSGDAAAVLVKGQVTLAKTASIVILDGGRVYWDRSANTATPLCANAQGDFFVGVAVGDCASADALVTVDLNVQPAYQLFFGRGEWESTPVYTNGTAALDFFAGTAKLTLTNTAEAMKIDLISKDSVPASCLWIAEGKVAIYDVGDNAALDINVGVANATHASDADSITESCFLHVDGNSLNINAESDDGTTEVAAADTTVDAVDDTYFEFWIDGRDPDDLQIYINGVLVLASTVFKLDAATGPLKLLAHVEKSSDDTTADFRISHLAMRLTDVA